MGTSGRLLGAFLKLSGTLSGRLPEPRRANFGGLWCGIGLDGGEKGAQEEHPRNLDNIDSFLSSRLSWRWPGKPVEVYRVPLMPFLRFLGLSGTLWGLPGGYRGLRQGYIYWPSAHPATVPGLWIRALRHASWGLFGALSGASGG